MCATNLICFYSRVIDIIQEREGWADCVYMDLKKAFDKVPHKRLLRKIEKNWWNTGKPIKMDGGLSGGQRDEGDY